MTEPEPPIPSWGSERSLPLPGERRARRALPHAGGLEDPAGCVAHTTGTGAYYFFFFWGGWLGLESLKKKDLKGEINYSTYLCSVFFGGWLVYPLYPCIEHSVRCFPLVLRCVPDGRRTRERHVPRLCIWDFDGVLAGSANRFVVVLLYVYYCTFQHVVIVTLDDVSD